MPEELNEVAVDEVAPKKARKARAPKLDENGEPIVKAPRATKEVKEKVLDTRTVTVLVTAENSGLRKDSLRYQYLLAAENTATVAELRGLEVTNGEKVAKITPHNIAGMVIRGHIQLS